MHAETLALAGIMKKNEFPILSKCIEIKPLNLNDDEIKLNNSLNDIEEKLIMNTTAHHTLQLDIAILENIIIFLD